MNNRDAARHIFLAGIKGVLPDKVIRDLISLRGSILRVGYNSYDLERFRNIYVVGAGKASAAMGHYIESVLHGHITSGHIVTKYGYSCKLKKVKVTEAGHPVPDENSFSATSDIIRIAETASENDLVICVWSGGGSSLLADHPESSSQQEMMFFNDMLVRCGADIAGMNIVRKHLSKVKGGQLIRHIWPASCVTLYLSDVTGDSPDTVASGPTSPDNSTFSDALKVLEKYSLKHDMPGGLLNYILQGEQGIHPDTPKPGDVIFSKASAFLAGNNKSALLAAAKEAEKMGFSTFMDNSGLTGDIPAVADLIIDSVQSIRKNTSIQKPVCLLFGGETTIKISGEGQGGRNQHLALTMAVRLQEIPGVTFLAGGTDGNDGNTEMAGAVVDSGTLQAALSMNVDAIKFLEEFDSYNFFRASGGHIFTGPTMTNVMDIAVAIIE